MTQVDLSELKSILLRIDANVSAIRAKEETELLTPAEVCKLLKIGKTTYQRYVDNNVFKQIKIQGKAYVQRTEIERLIEQGKI